MNDLKREVKELRRANPCTTIATPERLSRNPNLSSIAAARIPAQTHVGVAARLHSM